MTHTASEPDNPADRPDDDNEDDSDDDDLDELVEKIFNIIPSYADEDRLLAVRRAIHEYVIRKLRERQ